MIRTTLWTATVLAALTALPAEARFGKGGGGHSSYHGSTSSSPRKSTHAATPIGGGSSTGYVGGYGYGGGYYQPRWYSGFYYGSFVPYYGYGWGYPASYGYGYGDGHQYHYQYSSAAHSKDTTAQTELPQLADLRKKLVEMGKGT